MVISGANSSSAVPRSRKILTSLSSRCAGYLSLVVVTLAVSSYLAAQVDSDDVHILPRGMNCFSAPREGTVRANVDLVLVNVTVLDSAGRAVTGLKPNNFAVLDGKNPQVVKYLSNEDEPISLVVVLDASASMAPKIEEARRAFTELIGEANPQDEFGLITVGDKPRVALQFDDSRSEIQSVVDRLQPEGSTALWDGMLLGVKELRNSRYQRKAMIVISDGGDNHSRYTESELRSLLEEADVEVYAIGMFDRYATRVEEKKGPLQLDEVTSVTGGRVFSVNDSSELSRAVSQISHEMRNQYVLGYYPSNRMRDGKWRKLKIRVTTLPSQERIRLYARKGYYAPAE